MTPKTAIIELHYFPCIAFFKTIFSVDTVQLEAHESFQKQTYRNRCYILTANKIDRLSIPVLGGAGTPIKELQIDYKQKWENRHWRAIESAYANAPFFEHYESFFRTIIYGKETFLYDLNLKLLKTCLKLIGKGPKIEETEQYFKEYPSNLADFRGKVHPKRENLEVFTPYQQVFGENFIKNLSILDLLFCEGPNSINFIQ